MTCIFAFWVRDYREEVKMVGKKVLSTKDVAELLGTSTANIRMMVYRGQLPARKLGGRIVFLEEELKEHLRKLPRVVPERSLRRQ